MGARGRVSKNPRAIVVSGNGNVIVANGAPAAISIFDPAGNFVTSFSLSDSLDVALSGADLSSDGNSLFYTSGGSSIRKLQLYGPGAGTVTTFATISWKKLFGVRVVPVCSLCGSATGILVAAQYSVYLLDGTSGAIVRQYTITGQSDVKVLALDPLVTDTFGHYQVSDFFWVGSPNCATFSRVSFTTGLSTAYSSGSSGVQSLATYGGFSASQAVPTAFPVATIRSSPTSSVVDAFSNGNDMDQLTLSGFGTAFTTNVSVFASSIAPASGFSDDGLPCTPTLSARSAQSGKFDADPPIPPGGLMAMKIFSSPGAAPPDALLKQTSLLRNEREDVTTGIRNQDPIGASRFSVYSLNNRSGAGGESDKHCTYFAPVGEGATLHNPGNITFRFQCAGLPGAQLKTLLPRISVVKLVSGAAPQPFFPGLTDLTGGTCCTIAKYRYDAKSNIWVINVSFKGVYSLTTFIATTFDDNHIASTFDVGFSVKK